MWRCRRAWPGASASWRSPSASRETSEKWVRELGPRSPGRHAPGRRPLSPSFRGTGVGARAAAPPARPGQARGVSVTTSLVLCPRSLAAGRLPRSSCPPHSARLGPGPAAPRRGTQFLLPSPGHSPHGSGLGLPAGGHRRTAIVPGRVPGGRASAASLPVPGTGCGRGAPRAAPSSRAGRLRRSGEPLPPRCAALSAFLHELAGLGFYPQAQDQL